MKLPVLKTLENYKLRYLLSDIFAGIIVAAMSIPISMGYAQICGLPAVYGLYGSVLPIIFFAIFSTSPQFIFGVDAAPCAIVGGLLSTLGIGSSTQEAMTVVPAVTFCAGIWLLIFSLLKAGKLVNFISTPVMGGFVSGIAVTIIMMQFPKLLGSTVGEGELFELIIHIADAFKNPNLLSFAIGLGTIAIILLSKKFIPKFPMPIVVMILGALSTLIFHIDQYGVKLLDAVQKGLPPITISFVGLDNFSNILGTSLTVAIVIMAETLLSENNFAMKNNYKINDNREIFTFSIANLVSSFTGGVPVNGSISRTVMAEQFGGKSQLMSLVAGGAMVLVLLFATDFIAYLPVPVLTGIIISALIGVIEFDVAKRLAKVSKADIGIFLAAFFGVLVLGTIFGVVIGMLLSFVAVIIRAVNPGRSFVGVINGKDGFFSIERNRQARPIEHVIIYKFSGNLFFANINTLVSDIEKAVKPDTKVIIIDASGVSSVDITASDRLDMLAKKYRSMGIHFYITEHIGQVNDQIRKFGHGSMIDDGVVRRTITLALSDSHINLPYILEDGEAVETLPQETSAIYEYEWAYGRDAEQKMEEAVHTIMEYIRSEEIDTESVDSAEFLKSVDLWIQSGTIDEDELIVHLEMHLKELSLTLHKSEEYIEAHLEQRRAKIAERLKDKNPDAYNALRRHREAVEEYLRKNRESEFEHFVRIHKARMEHFKQKLENSSKENKSDN